MALANKAYPSFKNNLLTRDPDIQFTNRSFPMFTVC